MKRYSRKYEKHETPSEERRESKAYERKERMMGWELPLHKHHTYEMSHHANIAGHHFTKEGFLQGKFPLGGFGKKR
jgi:hypothetical protein